MFPADDGLMHVQGVCDIGLVKTCFHQSVNLITLVLGELRVVSHQCLSFLPERKAVLLLQLASYSDT